MGRPKKRCCFVAAVFVVVVVIIVVAVKKERRPVNYEPLTYQVGGSGHLYHDNWMG
jgi:hypothetical protein